MKSLDKLRLYWALLRIRRNPQATHFIFDISDALIRLGAFTEAEKKLKADPTSKSLIEARKFIAQYNLKDLANCPENSLGLAYYKHMSSNSLDPDFYRRIDVKDDATYITMRMRQTHDLWHVVTGFDISEEGEIGLQAFMMAQTQVPLTPILVGGAIMNAGTEKPDRLIGFMKRVIFGFQMGSEAKSLFNFDWEANWNRSLDEIRSENRIPAQK